MVDTHGLTHLYTAPTAIRALRRLGDEHVTPFKLSTLRVLGSVGEPINPEAWLWYHSVVGRGQCSVVDTYWQTGTLLFYVFHTLFKTTYIEIYIKYAKKT